MGRTWHRPWIVWDARESGVVRYAVLDATTVRERVVKARPHQLLRVLSQVMDALPVLPVGIGVVAGPGTFSAIRTGVLQANVLARLLRIPLVNITPEEVADLSTLGRKLAEGAKPGVSYVAPLYDREPNITVRVCQP